jgi:hypothetical protein
MLLGLPLYGEEKRNRFTLRTYYDTKRPLEYENLYMMSRIRLGSIDRVQAGLTLVKGCGAAGCYPQGYVREAESGLYEYGSYYIRADEVLGCTKIIFGNYVPYFGQGLLFGGSYPLILYNPYYDLALIRDRVYASYSTSKAVLLEGLTAEIPLGMAVVRPFLSWNRFDCTAGESDYYLYNDNDGDGVPNDADADDFSGYIDAFPPGYSCKNPLCSCIRDSGDYAYSGDRAKRNNLTEYMAGLNVSFGGDSVKLGGSIYYSWFNRLIDPYYSFEPEKGDKTAQLFRGKSYGASSVYFKLYEPVEIFGEVALTMYRRLSYYSEFNDDFISSLAFSGGMRKKLTGMGLILWGAYIPSTFVNPHGLELPDGLNNVTAALCGLHHTSGPRRFIHWLYGYSELYASAEPGQEEWGVSYNHRIELPLGSLSMLKLRHNLELIEHHYYAPDYHSLRFTSKITLLRNLSQSLRIQGILENRMGGPLAAGDPFHVGTGLSGELIVKRKSGGASLLLILYSTDPSRYSFLYPYERSLYDWSFVSRALHGNGFAGAAQLYRSVWKELMLGAKVRYQYDLKRKDSRSLAFYLTSQVPF